MRLDTTFKSLVVFSAANSPRAFFNHGLMLLRVGPVPGSGWAKSVPAVATHSAAIIRILFLFIPFIPLVFI